MSKPTHLWTSAITKPLDPHWHCIVRNPWKDNIQIFHFVPKEVMYVQCFCCKQVLKMMATTRTPFIWVIRPYTLAYPCNSTGWLYREHSIPFRFRPSQFHTLRREAQSLVQCPTFNSQGRWSSQIFSLPPLRSFEWLTWSGSIQRKLIWKPVTSFSLDLWYL